MDGDGYWGLDEINFTYCSLDLQSEELEDRVLYDLQVLAQVTGYHFCLALCCPFPSVKEPSQVFGLTPAFWLSCKAIWAGDKSPSQVQQIHNMVTVQMGMVGTCCGRVIYT